MTKPNTTRSDPLASKYFLPISSVDFWLEVLFYVGAILSLVTPYIDKNEYTALYNGIFSAFAFVVVAMFLLSLISRLYLMPRAQEMRRQEFLSTAYGVRLIHEQTRGYYNNNARTPTKKLAAQLLENSLFSKTIAIRMARWERAKVGVYFALWLFAVFNRSTDIGVVAAASQALFSEQILSKWTRLEWLRMRCEFTYERVYSLFQSNPASFTFDAMIIDYLGAYEAAKANAGVSLSSKVFDEVNAEVSAEWERIRETLRIDSI